MQLNPMTAPQSAPNVTSTSSKESVKWTAPPRREASWQKCPPLQCRRPGRRHDPTGMRVKALPMQAQKPHQRGSALAYNCRAPTDRRCRLKEQGMRGTVLALIFFITPAGNAQQVYKCVKGTDVCYQSLPCAETHSTVKQWEAVPEPAPMATGLHTRQRQSRAGSAQLERASGDDRKRSVRRTSKTSSINTADRRCSAAKARREAKLASVGLKRTFDLLRKLDDAVHEACKQ